MPLSPALILVTLALLLAFGCSQRIWGPLSDRVGHSPILPQSLERLTEFIPNADDPKSRYL